MLRKTIKTTLTASVLASTLIFPIQALANHDDSHSVDVGGLHICFGVWSCMFHPADPKPRDANGAFDHRTGPIDQDPEIPPGASARIHPTPRSTRPAIAVRDHRK